MYMYCTYPGTCTCTWCEPRLPVVIWVTKCTCREGWGFLVLLLPPPVWIHIKVERPETWFNWNCHTPCRCWFPNIHEMICVRVFILVFVLEDSLTLFVWPDDGGHECGYVWMRMLLLGNLYAIHSFNIYHWRCMLQHFATFCEFTEKQFLWFSYKHEQLLWWNVHRLDLIPILYLSLKWWYYNDSHGIFTVEI